MLLDLSQTASIGASIEAADRVLTRARPGRRGAQARVQQAGFVVLKSPDMPSMLVETAYISNPAEERKLRSGDYQQRLAEAIFARRRAATSASIRPTARGYAAARRAAPPARRPVAAARLRAVQHRAAGGIAARRLRAMPIRILPTTSSTRSPPAR